MLLWSVVVLGYLGHRLHRLMNRFLVHSHIFFPCWPLPTKTKFRVKKHTLSTTVDYKVPRYFDNDLFGLISESRRPPYRWFLVGPERSGTTVHIDPLATAAWNTLIVGRKRWVLFPPHVPKHVAKGKHFVRKGEDDEAIHYFMIILPRIKAKAKEVGNRGFFKDFACYEFTQEAGETVFIPNGWW